MDSWVKLHTFGRYINGRNAEVEGDHLDHFKFLGVDRYVGVVKILEPVSPMLNYFELQIIDKGEDTAIGIGVGEYKYPLDKMPGWNSNAIGYHADDGRLFYQNGFGKAFGPLCTTGDKMGCGIDFDCDVGPNFVNVFFTKNGKQIGAPTKVKKPIYGFYPLFGLHSPNEKIAYLGHCRMLPELIAEPMETEKSPSVYWLRSNGVKFLEDSLTLEYFGDGLNCQDVGIAQTKDPLTPCNHYFELKILDSGEKGWIAIGLGKSTYPLTRHPGWNAGSIGYHADNGNLYKETGHGERFGPTCTAGDTMGCGIKFPKDFSNFDHFRHSNVGCDLNSELSEDISTYGLEEDYDDDSYDDSDRKFDDDQLYVNMQQKKPQRNFHNEKFDGSVSKSVECIVYFTKNGEVVGEVVCTLPSGGFHPLVAMLSAGEKIRVNVNPLSG